MCQPLHLSSEDPDFGVPTSCALLISAWGGVRLHCPVGVGTREQEVVLLGSVGAKLSVFSTRELMFPVRIQVCT